MHSEEPSFTTEYDAEVGDADGAGDRATERRTLQTKWGDLDPTPWESVADKAAATAAVKRYHDALVTINGLRADDREAALALVGDLSGQDIYAVAARVETAARDVAAKTQKLPPK